MNDLSSQPSIQKILQSLAIKYPRKGGQGFQENRNHPSLGIKKIKGRENIWEGRVDQFYRFTFEYRTDPDTGDTICLFRNIGRHDIVDHAP